MDAGPYFKNHVSGSHELYHVEEGHPPSSPRWGSWEFEILTIMKIGNLRSVFEKFGSVVFFNLAGLPLC